jgi:competence ComEA-like helix-hairpin-helix protein
MLKDINDATAEELAKVPLITPARAETIISWRDNHGPIADMAELQEIPGIGQKTVEKMTQYFSTSGSSTRPEPDASGARPDDPTEGEDEGEEAEEGTDSGVEEGEPDPEDDSDEDEEDEDPDEDPDEDTAA